MAEARTVKVRGYAVVNASGKYSLYGRQGAEDTELRDTASDLLDEEPQFGRERGFWVTLELPLPEEPEVAAEVQSDGE